VLTPLTTLVSSGNCGSNIDMYLECAVRRREFAARAHHDRELLPLRMLIERVSAISNARSLWNFSLLCRSGAQHDRPLRASLRGTKFASRARNALQFPQVAHSVWRWTNSRSCAWRGKPGRRFSRHESRPDRNRHRPSPATKL